jgi:alpha-beta hydrolase superfamily lysophospholipase
MGGNPGGISHDSILLTRGEPTSRVYLLLHGLTASPRQFSEFGRLLFERGATVSIPRLPRHGLTDRLTTELEGLSVEELRDFARASTAYAQTLGRRLTVVGFSVGGLLAAWIGQNIAVDRATAVAPFLGPAWLPTGLIGRVARATLLMPNRFLWWNPFSRERQMPAHGYPRFPTHAVAQAITLGQELLAQAGRSAPAAHDVQILVNASEAAANNWAAQELAALWSAHEGGRIVLHRLSGLPPSHDIIEPLRSPQIARSVYAALLDLVER